MQQKYQPDHVSTYEHTHAHTPTHSHAHTHTQTHTHTGGALALLAQLTLQAGSTRNAYSHKEIEIRACKIANSICGSRCAWAIFLPDFQFPIAVAKAHFMHFSPGMLIMLFPYAVCCCCYVFTLGQQLWKLLMRLILATFSAAVVRTMCDLLSALIPCN